MIAVLLALPIALAQDTVPTAGEPAPPPAAQTPAAVAFEAPAPPPASAPPVLVKVTLSDGQVLRGRVDPAVLAAWKAGDPLELGMGGLTGLSLPAELVAAVEQADAATSGIDTAYAASTRHFFTPTAIPLKKGTGYVSQMEVLATLLTYGVTDWLTLEAGTSIPLALFGLTMTEEELVNFFWGIAGAKVAAPVASQVHVAAGGFGLVSGEVQVGLPYAEVTLGDPDRNVTFGAGTVFANDVDGTLVPVVAAATWRLRPKLGLVTENWLVFEDGDFLVSVDTLGVRFFPERGRWSVDVALGGALTNEGEFYFSPIPWLDVSWHFGG